MSARGRMLAAVLLLAGCGGGEPAAPEGFAGLGRTSDEYAQVEPGREFVFPADHGAHPGFRIEWWYVTANLRDAQGNDYGTQWTLFRYGLRPDADSPGWDDGNIWMGHAGVTTADDHRAAERLARGGVGQAGAEAASFRAWIDDWTLAGRPETGMHVRAGGDGFAFSLQLASRGPLVLQGDGGFSLKSRDGQASYYYSHPFLHASGELEIDGRRVEVSGPAWMDREWSSQPLAGDQLGWDWFSLRLDGGGRLMLFQLRHAGGGHYLSGTWIEPDGTATALEAGDVRLEAIAQATVADRDVPIHWTLAIPAQDFEVEVSALNPDAWMELGTPYWEGPVRVRGSASGVGYLEMTGY
ncbi:lipocalin-like domain-containing protein [Novilysobacter defluvii]|uniref:Iron ABC transporter permease n=1 Tax=Lysobacter defluvii IMMIB APB-9 = DSM 18482 TaxID=1385515 RepID=A0A0A0M9T7_9GAMM|nr:lipocalin-like domain-containing protein [Lysobacter defluvii]KGO98974.1 iron ABC transporter permease [Lysobacter defluvii IMMIB APB-9 = DSM 18482]